MVDVLSVSSPHSYRKALIFRRKTLRRGRKREVCQIANDPIFIKLIITGIEMWTNEYDFEIVQQSSEQ